MSVICLWSGTVNSIPENFVLCDGNNGTPDLRDRFILGAGSTYSVNDTGGQNEISGVPEHSHSVTGNALTTGDHTHNSNGTNTDGAHVHNTNNAGAHSHNTSNNGAHTHTMKIPGIGAAGGSQTDTRINGNRSGSRSTNFSGFHNHNSNSSGAHTHNTNTEGNHTHNTNVGSAGAHSHSVSGDLNSSGSASVDIRPVYYALAYIMEVN